MTHCFTNASSSQHCNDGILKVFSLASSVP